MDKIWVPDSYFYNEHSSEIKDTLVIIEGGGRVTWSHKVQVVFTEVSVR